MFKQGAPVGKCPPALTEPEWASTSTCYVPGASCSTPHLPSAHGRWSPSNASMASIQPMADQMAKRMIRSPGMRIQTRCQLRLSVCRTRGQICVDLSDLLKLNVRRIPISTLRRCAALGTTSNTHRYCSYEYYVYNKCVMLWIELSYSVLCNWLFKMIIGPLLPSH